ncbi:cytochrome P450 [Coprinopsis marcescibilis]|uniref:Cytochrome P450 n=1 Tax=Coprinopsis marcescibilis TaxID=230819 RepID=A0A5C3KVW5_COPMA|nr:cytochrome P450 [Coprinopsis marcescibilis]
MSLPLLMDALIRYPLLPAVAASGLLWYWLNSSATKPHIRPLPGPRRLPFIGNALQMPQERPWLTFAEWAKTYGDLFQVDILGRPLVVINSATVARDLLDKRSATNSDRPHFTMAGDLIGYNTMFPIMPYGDGWRQQRRLISQDFSHISVQRYAPLQEREAGLAIRNALENPGALRSELGLHIGIIIIRITYGYYIKSKDDPFLTTPLQAMNNFSIATTPGNFLVDFIPSLRRLPSWMPGGGFHKTAQEWKEIVRKATYGPYEWAKANLETGQTLMPSLCGTTISDGFNNSKEENTLICAASSVMGGGLDTNVSSALTFFLAMTLYPDIQKTAQAEIDSVIGTDRLPCIADRASLPYIRSLMTEVLRWGPATPMGIAHASTQDDVYEGYHIPGGAILMPNVWKMLHDPDVYANPMEFVPERYGNSAAEMRKVYDLAFGFGRRVCPGINLAEGTLFSIIATALATCTIHPALDNNGKPILPDPTMYTPGTIRYHVGESMLPSLPNYLDFIGVKEEFVKHGFLVKPGASFKLVQGLRDSWTDFTALGPGYLTWNVVRSEMDDLLFRHAKKQGVHTFDETKVDSVQFEGDPKSSRPTSAQWTRKDGTSGKIDFEWLVDASGRAGLLSTKYLGNRHMRENLRNVAVWAYWKGCKRFGEGTIKANSGWFEALTDQTGWAWVIPLHDGTTSIGFVMHITNSNKKKAKLGPDGKRLSLTEHYLDQLQYVPGVRDLIGETGTRVSENALSASDFSYSADRYSGDHFRIIGDAANFIDPFFSSGVHIAMTGALSAAATICASIKGEIDEPTAQLWHDAKVGISHTRFLFVVLGAYKQMHMQEELVLADVNSRDFDGAFKMFQPVIFGLADSQKKLTDEAVQDMMDVCQRFFDPLVDEDQIKRARQVYGVEVIKMTSAPLGKQKIKELVQDDAETERVLRKFDAIKVLGEDVEATFMGKSAVLGYRANIKRGELGLVKVAPEPREPDVIVAVP